MRLKFLKFITLASGCFITPYCYSSSGQFNDWVESYEPHNLCHGYYQPPQLPTLTKNSEEYPLTIHSDKAQFSANGNSKLSGNVLIQEASKQLYSDTIDIVRDSYTNKISTIHALGNITIVEADWLIKADKGEINRALNYKSLDHVIYHYYPNHARGEAKDIIFFDKEGTQKADMQNASYTSCAPHNDTWMLKAKKLRLDKTKGRGRAKNAFLYFKSIPVFYSPYLDFPIDARRQTGFLNPEPGFDSHSGYKLSIPFYWNLAPNYDLVLSPTLISKRGIQLATFARHLTPKSYSELNFNFLPQDRAYQKFIKNFKYNHPNLNDSNPKIKGLRQTNRYLLSLKHKLQISPHLKQSIDYTKVGDDNYFLDLDPNFGNITTYQLLQEAALNAFNNNWQISTKLQQYQVLHPFKGIDTQDLYRRLPQITINGDYPNLPLGLNFSLPFEYSFFSHKKDPITNASFTVGKRYQMRPSISLPMIHPGWFFKPKLQLNTLLYDTKLSYLDQTHQIKGQGHLSIPMFEIDSGLIFEKNIHLNKKSFVQTLEPRLYYLYVPYKNQNDLPSFDTGISAFDFNQLYRDNRFSGLDRVGDAKQITLGMSSRLLSPEGLERLRVEAGQIFYLKERKVSSCNPTINPFCLNEELPVENKKRSNFAIKGTYKFSPWLASIGLETNSHMKKFEKYSLSVQYQPTSYNVVNVGYQYLKHDLSNINVPNSAIISSPTDRYQPLKQWYLSSAIQLHPKWRILGKIHYDATRHSFSNTLIGIEQESCCTGMRLVALRTLLPLNTSDKYKKHYDTRVMVQVVFKGLTNIGHNHLKDSLSQAITGYSPSKENF
ncbi:MAG: hypothetical protein JWM09_131 [Francisellaceae bacterium]|nr:hypothetical protein [Francisellaceae bacterium]